MKLENGVTLNMQDVCNETLTDEMHVWVILKAGSVHVCIFLVAEIRSLL